jgi:hypothetical protein
MLAVANQSGAAVTDRAYGGIPRPVSLVSGFSTGPGRYTRSLEACKCRGSGGCLADAASNQLPRTNPTHLSAHLMGERRSCPAGENIQPAHARSSPGELQVDSIGREVKA